MSKHHVSDKLYAELAGVQVGDQQPVRIMGIVNVSPESFFKGSISTSTDAVKRSAEQMVVDGADILDIGARGTAPYLKTEITVEEETERIVRAVRAVREVTYKPISVDTQTASVAEAAHQAGASILNDISGLAHDPALAAVAKQYDGVILMANGDYVDSTGEPVSVVKSSLEATLRRALDAGIAPEKIVLDPGIGFFRDRTTSWDAWDRIILQQLPAFQIYDRPLMVSISRKSFIGKVLNYDNPADRLYGSLGLTSLLVQHGANIIRTHDVLATKDVVRIAEWLA
jgi:dihydropteroate synthase